MNEYNKKSESNLLEMKKKKEEADKRLLTMEIIMGAITMIMYLGLVMIASYVEMSDNARLLIIIPSTVLVLIMCFIALRIEQVSGYYECRKCHHKYVPTYSSVLLAMHIARTRYMKCPKCNKRSWNKKVISK